MAKVVKRFWNRGKPNEKWTWAVRYQHNGKQHIKSFKTHKGAKDWAAQVEHEKKQGIHTPASRSITVKDAGKLLLEKSEQNGLARWTIHNYRKHIKNQIEPRLGGMKLNELTIPLVERFCDGLSKTGKLGMARRTLICLKLILKEAVRCGLVAQNVARDVQITGGKKRRKLVVGRDVPTAEEIKLLIEDEAKVVIDPTRGPVITTIALTGMRGGEVRALRWIDLDLDHPKYPMVKVQRAADQSGTIRFTKSEAGDREIPLVSTVVDALRDWMQRCPSEGRLIGFKTPEYKVFEIQALLKDNPGITIKEVSKRLHVAPISVSLVQKAMPITSSGRLGFVFPSRMGTVRAHAVLQAQLAERQRRLGIVGPDGKAKYSLHKLRHFFATWLIKRGCPIKRLQYFMGHATAAMTLDTYGHFYKDRKDDRAQLEAAEAALLGSSRQKTLNLRQEPDNSLMRLD